MHIVSCMPILEDSKDESYKGENKEYFDKREHLNGVSKASWKGYRGVYILV